MEMLLTEADQGQACSICGALPQPQVPRLMDIRGKTGFQAFFCCNCSIEFFVAIGMSIHQAFALLESPGEAVH